MELREFKEKVFALADEKGFSEYEIYYSKNDTLSINVYEAEVDKYTVSSSMGLSFRGLFEGKMGYAYTEILDEAAVEMLVNNAVDNAKSIESSDEEFIYGGGDNYSTLKGYDENLAAVGADKKIELALALEKEARAKSDKVVNISYCGVGSSEEECGIINSKGVDISYKSNLMFGMLRPVVTDGTRMYNGTSLRAGKDFAAICPKAMAEEAVEEALSCIGAASVKSGNYKIALRNDVAATLLATFSGAFSAENAQKGLSRLKGKAGQRIAADKVTVLDDPLLAEGLNSAPFDAEGAATYRKEVISSGVLTTLLHNLKTAAKDGVKTTANASKASYASPVTIAPANFYIEAGEKSFTELLGFVGEGLLITELAGTHAGANPVTGDFSLAAKGYVIKEGRVDRAVEQITVAGNFFSLLENIEEVGSDLEFDMPSSSGCFGSPTIVVKELAVAGN